MDIRTELAEMMDGIQTMIPTPKETQFMITPGLDLLDVGVAIASDNVKLQFWRAGLGTTRIYRPSDEQLRSWN